MPTLLSNDLCRTDRKVKFNKHGVDVCQECRYCANECRPNPRLYASWDVKILTWSRTVVLPCRKGLIDMFSVSPMDEKSAWPCRCDDLVAINYWCALRKFNEHIFRLHTRGHIRNNRHDIVLHECSALCWSGHECSPRLIVGRSTYGEVRLRRIHIHFICTCRWCSQAK